MNIAVIGAGYWGPNLIRVFHQHPEAKVLHICDRDGVKLARQKHFYPEALLSTDAEAVIRDPRVDAVVLATPVSTHFPLGKLALQCGKHLFVEKPFTATAREAAALIALAARKKLTLMTGHTFLYSAPVRKLKELLAAREFGKVLYVYSQRLNLGLFQPSLNVLWDLAPHDLSILFHLFRAEEVEVLAAVGSAHYFPKIEDVAFVSLRIRNVFVNLHLSWLDPTKVRKMSFIGTKKMINYDDIEPMEKLRIYDKRVTVPDEHHNFGEFQVSYRYGDVLIPKVSQTEPLRVEADHFIECIRTGKEPLSSGVQGLHVVRALERITRVMRRNR